MSNPLIREGAMWLSITSQLYSTRMTQLLAAHDLTVPQFGILNHIARGGPTKRYRVSEISKAVEVGQPAVTKIIVKFESMGLVSISEDRDDKRVKHITVTPEVHNLLGQITASIGPNIGQAFRAIDPDDLPKFIENLKHLGQWLDQNRL